MLLTGGRGPHGDSRSGFSTLLESSQPRPLNLSCPYRTDTKLPAGARCRARLVAMPRTPARMEDLAATNIPSVTRLAPSADSQSCALPTVARLKSLSG